MIGLRPDLEEIDPYVSPQLPARLRMNTNESPYRPPQAVAQALEGLVLNRYPDRDATQLVDALAAKWEWPRDGVWVANGSNEVFMHLFLAFGGPGRTAVTFEPTYSLHSLIPRLALTEVAHARRDGDLVGWVREHAPDVVVVCSPNNPTGECTPLPTISALAGAAPGLVVVDEAYGEFADETAVPLLRDHANLVVVRTFSKAWSLAGVRLGYMLAAPRLVTSMSVVRLPYHLSALSQAVGVAALSAEDETLQAVGAITSERERVVRGLAELGLRPLPSQANFVLFEVSDAPSVWKALFERGVLVRSYEGSEDLGAFLRVTVGLPDENDEFLRTLGAVLA